jgi:hypothetical protein
MACQAAASKAPWQCATKQGSNKSYHHTFKPRLNLLLINGHKSGGVEGGAQLNAAKPGCTTRTNHLPCPCRQSSCICVLLEGIGKCTLCLNPCFSYLVLRTSLRSLFKQHAYTLSHRNKHTYCRWLLYTINGICWSL